MHLVLYCLEFGACATEGLWNVDRDICMKRVAVIMTCYNRAQTTLECLRHLRVCCNAFDLVVDVWINDDGSDDGTSESIRRWRKENSNESLRVCLLQGSGCDYWCGGMRRAWAKAVSSGVVYDGYIWLNDDTMLLPNALEQLLIRDDAIVVGSTYNPDTGALSYGGRGIDGQLIVPNGSPQLCEMMNGNVVYVPRKVYEELGNFSDFFTHALGDYDYARRARRQNIAIVMTAGYVGACKDDKPTDPWFDPRQPFVLRVKKMYSGLCGIYPPVFFRYNLRHDGLWQAVRLWINQNLRMIFPWLWGQG